MNNNPNLVAPLYGKREQAAQYGFLLIAISYSLVVLNSPLPSTPGLTEAVIGTGLLIGSLLVLINGNFSSGRLRIAAASQIFILIYGGMIGILYSNSLANMLRDIIPHIYIVTPAFLVSVSKAELRHFALKCFTVAVVLVGIVSSIQFLYGILSYFGTFSSFTHMMMVGYHGGASGAASEDLSNVISATFKKNYDPSILFASIVLLGGGVSAINSNARLYGAMAILLGAGLGYGIFLLGLRAHAAIIVSALILYVIYLIRRMPSQRWKMWLAVLAAIILIPIVSSDLLQVMLAKQALVGSNGKLLEFMSVWEHITKDVTKFTLGYGWGAYFYNPILSSEAGFTHSVISYYLLKTGIIGIALSVLTLICISPASINRITRQSHILVLLGVASIAALSVCLLQPTYKMLSFGIILAIVAMLARADEDTHYYVLRTLHNKLSKS